MNISEPNFIEALRYQQFYEMLSLVICSYPAMNYFGYIGKYVRNTYCRYIGTVIYNTRRQLKYINEAFKNKSHIMVTYTAYTYSKSFLHAELFINFSEESGVNWWLRLDGRCESSMNKHLSWVFLGRYTYHIHLLISYTF